MQLVNTMLVATNMIMKTMKSTPKWPDDYQEWTGSFEELVTTAGKILEEIDPAGGVPTGSLVRYYQQQGAVGRGRKNGRSACFDHEDLARVVATKQMANQQVPLSITKEFLAYAPVDTIVRNSGICSDTTYSSPAAAASAVLSHQTGNEAERAVAKLLASSNYANCGLEGGSGILRGAIAPMPVEFSDVKNNALLMQSQPTLPPGGVVRYALTAGVTVEIPADGGRRKEQAEALRAFAQQLYPLPPNRSYP